MSLAEQIGGHQLRIGGVVRDHRDLGRARQEIDADPAEQLTLGLGDETRWRASTCPTAAG